MVNENWKPVTGTDGRYEVSDTGNVRSWIHPGGARRKVPLVLTPSPIAKGYLCVGFRLNDGRVCKVVSNLVLEAFVGPRPTTKHQAAHLDNNKRNNRLDNLIWATPKENGSHKRAHGTQPFRERRIENGRHVYRCPHCNAWKSAEHFHRSKRAEHQLQSWCKRCANDERMERRRKKVGEMRGRPVVRRAGRRVDIAVVT
jgi:hypothetical protein